MGKVQVTCPLCKGEAKILVNQNVYDPKVRAMARKLFAGGMSFRQIGKRIGVPHAQQVKSLIMAKTL